MIHRPTSLNLVLLIFLFSFFHYHSAKSQKPITFQMGYLGTYAVAPGLNVGASFTLKEWSGQADINREQSLVLSTDLALLNQLEDRNSFLIHPDLGWKRQKPDRPWYSIYGVGLGYQTENQLETFSVNLGSGAINDLDSRRRHYLVPTVSYEIGRDLKNRLGWYSKMMAGWQLAFDSESSLQLLLELGLKYSIHKNKS